MCVYTFCYIDTCNKPQLVANEVAVNIIALKTTVGLDGARVGSDVDNIATGGSEAAAGSRGGVVGEGDGAKVGQAASKVLDNPDGISLAECRWRVGELVNDLGTSVQVDEGSNARCLGRGVDLHADLVTNAEGEVGEEDNVVRNPLVPGIEGAVGVKVNTGLPESLLASIAINAYPRGAAGTTDAVAADLGDGGDAKDVVDAGAVLGDTSPVARVLGSNGAITIDGGLLEAVGHAGAAGNALLRRALVKRRSGSGSSQANQGGENGRVLHIDPR